MRLVLTLTAAPPLPRTTTAGVAAPGAGCPGVRRAGTGTVDLLVEAPEGTTFGALRDGLLAAAAAAGWTGDGHGRPPDQGDDELHLVGGAPVGSDDVLGAPPLLHGAELVLVRGQAATALRASAGPTASSGSSPRRAVTTLVATSGPAAGTRWGLPAGHHVVGREPGCRVVLPDPGASRSHAVLRVRASGVEVRDLGSTNGSTLEDSSEAGHARAPLPEGWTPLRRGAAVTIGASTLRLEAPPAPAGGPQVGAGGGPGRGRATGDGHLLLDPPAAEVLVRSPLTLEVPLRPTAPETPRVSWLAVVLPLGLAVVMALVWSPMALLFGLAAPVMVLGTSWAERRAGARRHGAELAVHARRRAVLRERAGVALGDDLALLRALGPDPGVVASAAAQRGRPLWGRAGSEVTLRLGTGRVVGAVEVRGDEGERGDDRGEGGPSAPGEEPLPETVHRGAPVLLSPSALGVIGVAGPGHACGALARSMLVGAAVLHSPAQLRIAVVGSAWPRWWWLPHALTDGGPTDAHAVLADVLALLRARRDRDVDRGQERSAGGAARRPEVLVLVDAAAGVDAAGVAELLEHGPAAGVHVLVTAESTDDLPPSCGAVVEVGGIDAAEGHVRLLLRGGGDGWGERPRSTPTAPAPAPGIAPGCVPGTVVTLDQVSTTAADASARHLAPLRARRTRAGVDAGGGSGDDDLPDRLALLDVLALDATDPSAVAAGWSASPRSARVVLGVRGHATPGAPAAPGTASASTAGTGTGGLPWTVDLDRDGPHVLVAGTTGAGKSELLVTLVTSLAVGNAPEECAFVLVDYKGGAAFADLVGLPHVVGMVTDLDTHLTTRALASLVAEVRRRERVLAAARCRDHAELTARRARGADLPVVPRLLVVVDEFRVLAQEVPDFLDGLVRLAAVGRSLGVHLVLATQRPAGVVSADIRANTSLRIALRVQDESDSRDVIDHRGAARISPRRPGRALVSVAGATPVAVQAARVAGVSAPARRPGGAPVITITALTGVSCPAAAGTRGPGDGGSGHDEPSDVVRVVAAVRAAATGMPLPASPWLPPLPDVVPLPLPTTGHGGAHTGAQTNARTGGGAGAGSDGPRTSLGLVDLPGQQRRADLTLDPSGPLLVVGAPRSGRSTALAAFAAASAGLADGRHVHLVARSSPPLVGVEELGCVGAMVDPDDHERLLRLLHHLRDLVTTRQRWAGHAGEPSSARAGERAGDVAPDGPLTLLLVDDAERLLAPRDAVLAAPGDDVGDLVHRLLTDGPAVGVVVVLAGDRHLLGGRWGPVVSRRWLLAAADPTDHVMAGVPAREVPSHMPPGRVLVVGDGPGAVVGQVGVVDDRARLADHAVAAGHRGTPPARVPRLPSHLVLADLLHHDQHLRRDNDDHRAGGSPRRGGAALDALGDLDDLDDLDDAARVPVGRGGPDAGIVTVDLAAGGAWLVAGPPGSGRSSALLTVGLSALSRGRDVVVVASARSPLRRWAGASTGVTLAPDDAEGLRGALLARSGRPGAGGGPDRERRGDLATVVLVDDVERVAGSSVDEVLCAALDGSLGAGAGGAVALVAAGSPDDAVAAYRGLLPAVRRSRRALLLHPVPPGAGDVGGVRLPPPPTGPPGRAVLLVAGHASAVQLASPGRAGRPDGPEGTGAHALSTERGGRAT